MNRTLAARLGLTTAVGPRGERRSRGLGLAPALLLIAGAGLVGVGAVSAGAVSMGAGSMGAGNAGGSAVVNVVDGQQLFTLHGHGHGHGRGMGQWGSLGYAQQGWAAEQILGHYYGGTELGVLEPSEMTVRHISRDGKPLEATSAGTLTVAGQAVAPGQSARLTPTADGARVQIAETCGGQVLWEGETTDPWVHSDVTASPLRLCGEDASYRGALGVALDGGQARTISKLDIEDYLRGVVPAESPANWADKGGAEALKAQAVAARSYAAAENRASYAKTCDTQACQVYRGAALDDPRTDEAIAATRGQVLTRDGVVVPAEFSSSTGGWSAGGDFPAVLDEGDAISPTHDWTKQIRAREIAEAFGVGELISMTVAQSNGLGPDGGRVLVLRVEGTTRTVEATGDEARVRLALKSDWFYIEGQEPAAVVPDPDPVPVPDPAALPAEEPDSPEQAPAASPIEPIAEEGYGPSE